MGRIANDRRTTLHDAAAVTARTAAAASAAAAVAARGQLERFLAPDAPDAPVDAPDAPDAGAGSVAGDVVATPPGITTERSTPATGGFETAPVVPALVSDLGLDLDLDPDPGPAAPVGTVPVRRADPDPGAAVRPIAPPARPLDPDLEAVYFAELPDDAPPGARRAPVRRVGHGPGAPHRWRIRFPFPRGGSGG
jgi:hypothetical protein